MTNRNSTGVYRTRMTSPRKPASAEAPRELLWALVKAQGLDTAVPAAIEIVERAPLASVGCFRGDLLRGLMEVPNGFWGRNPDLYDRYRDAVRAGASARRELSADARMEFWSPLDL